jgi:hypothetical protein
MNPGERVAQLYPQALRSSGTSGCHSPYPLLWAPEVKVKVTLRPTSRSVRLGLSQSYVTTNRLVGTDHKENNSSHCCCCIATAVYHCCTFSVNRQRLLLRLYHFDILFVIPFILDDYTWLHNYPVCGREIVRYYYCEIVCNICLLIPVIMNHLLYHKIKSSWR